MSKMIQEQFGETIISAVSTFAKSDLPSIENLVATCFEHVSDKTLQQTLAETFYGARWIYKLGLALLVKDAEQMAHVRTQVVDYGAVCEGLLSDALLHALETNRMRGQKYKYADPNNYQRPINWNIQDRLQRLSRQSFFWHIEVSGEARIVNKKLIDALHTMRNERNSIHMRARTHRAFVGTSKFLFATVLETIKQTKAWRRANP